MPSRCRSVLRHGPAGALLAAASLASGCSRTPVPPPTAPTAAAPCVVGSGGRAGPARLVGAALEADTLLLSPARSRLLLGLSCEGLVTPRLAAAWSGDSSGTAWTLTLPDPARLLAEWRAKPAPAAALQQAGVTSIVPLDERRLVFTFGRPQDGVPGVLADPALAATEPGPAPIRLLRGIGPDLRDALDGGTDLVVTADPAVLEYAAAQSGWESHALPWNRTYVLLTPGSDPVPLDDPSSDSAGFRDALARDAVRVAARAAQPPFWWEDTAGCRRGAVSPHSPPARVVVYPRSDEVARALAGRLVALSASGLVSRGLSEAELARTLAQASAAGYILWVPRPALVPCREVAAWPAGMVAVPLIDTRPTLLLRPGVGPLVVDHDGGLRPLERP